jgi:hypothetical protein
MSTDIQSLKDKVKAIEELELDEMDYSAMPPKDIFAFNEMRSCADIYRMIKEKQIEIQPFYQRSIVWTDKEQSKFIDSLMKSLPIPSMCISLDESTGHRQVIDGLQRMHSIKRFLSDEEWRLSSTLEIEPKISGKTNIYIKENEKKLYSNVENLTIPVTVIRCNYQKDNHLKYLFEIFNRLNTGGKKLSNQEIRNCIFSGPFNNLLIELKDYAIQKQLYYYDPSKPDRFEVEENILRFFAFEEHYQEYRGLLFSFLNDYMKVATQYDSSLLEKKRKLFVNTVDFIKDKLIYEIKDSTSKTILEGILIGISKNLPRLTSLEPSKFTLAVSQILASSEYQYESLSEGISSKEKVISRLNKSIEIFRNA